MLPQVPPVQQDQISSGSSSNPPLFLGPLTASPSTRSPGQTPGCCPYLLQPPPAHSRQHPGSIPNSLPPDSLCLISSTTPVISSPCLDSWPPVCPLCGPREVSVWPQRGLSIPRADLLCSSPPWLPSAPGQGPRPSIWHPRPSVIRSHPCPLGCISADLASWLGTG